MVQEALNKSKALIIETFKTFDRFCTDNDLSYFAAGGTAIGAVRHHGMIPWDDDIDVYMPRKDYERFLSLRSKVLPLGYIVYALGDKDFFYPFAKMFPSNTTLIECEESPTCCIGPYMDIFPLDEVSGSVEDIIKKKEKYSELNIDFYHTFCKPTLHNISSWVKRHYFRTVVISMAPDWIKKKIREKFLAFEKDWRQEKGERLFFHCATYATEREIYPKEWFTSYHYVPFEDCEIRINDRYDDYLTTLFGDYMTPPPVEQQIQKHPAFYLNLKERLNAKEAQKRMRKGEYLNF